MEIFTLRIINIYENNQKNISKLQGRENKTYLTVIKQFSFLLEPLKGFSLEMISNEIVFLLKYI